jgi:hypothetical protein
MHPDCFLHNVTGALSLGIGLHTAGIRKSAVTADRKNIKPMTVKARYMSAVGAMAVIELGLSNARKAEHERLAVLKKNTSPYFTS